MKRSAIRFVALLAMIAGPVAAQRAAVQSYGAGCAGSAGVPVLQPAGAALPVLGSPITLQVAPVPAGSDAICLLASCIRRSQPIDLATAGMPGCQLWIDPELFLSARASGTVLLLPKDPAFLGVPLQFQALVLDASVGPTPVILTQALQCLVGT